MNTEQEEKMVNKIFSQDDINVYDFSYIRDSDLQRMLGSFEEISWVDRVNGFKEGIIKTTNLKNLNLENRRLYVSFISEINSYLHDNSLAFVFPMENVFLKIIPETSYNQDFLNPGLVDTISVIYVANNNYSGANIKFLNKDISIPLSKGNLIIFPSGENYKYKISEVSSGELIVGVSYVEVKND
jgi:hypothetical protein